MTNDLRAAAKKAIEALHNVPEVGGVYDQQHADTHMRAVLALQDALSDGDALRRFASDCVDVLAIAATVAESYGATATADTLNALDKQAREALADEIEAPSVSSTLDGAAEAFAADATPDTAKAYRDAARQYAADGMITEGEAEGVARVVAPYLAGE